MLLPLLSPSVPLRSTQTTQKAPSFNPTTAGRARKLPVCALTRNSLPSNAPVGPNTCALTLALERGASCHAITKPPVDSAETDGSSGAPPVVLTVNSPPVFAPALSNNCALIFVGPLPSRHVTTKPPPTSAVTPAKC